MFIRDRPIIFYRLILTDTDISNTKSIPITIILEAKYDTDTDYPKIAF